MRFQIIILSIVLITLLNGCRSTETPVNTNTATGINNTSAAAANSNNPLSTTATPKIETTNNAPTIAPVVKAYYEALKNKDDAALRKVYSQDTLKSLEADMKDDKEKSLVKFITAYEKVPDAPYQVRNEKIEGDSAVAIMSGGSYPNGIALKFVKENGEWKMTNESPEIKSDMKPATNSNTAKK